MSNEFDELREVERQTHLDPNTIVDSFEEEEQYWDLKLLSEKIWKMEKKHPSPSLLQPPPKTH